MKIVVKVEVGEDSKGFLLEEIECDNIADGLRTLHERLNDIANPRQAVITINPGNTWVNPFGPMYSCQPEDANLSPHISC